MSKLAPLHREYASWGDLLAQVRREEAYTVDPERRSSRREGREKFTRTSSWEEALGLAENGWQEGEARVKSISQRIETAVLPGIEREDVNFDVEGMGFDIARFVEGEPEHWLRIEETTLDAHHKHVRVVYNCSASAGVKSEVIEARGAAAAALIEALEYAGVRVELVVVWAVSGRYFEGPRGAPLVMQTIRVKPYDQPLDLARIAFACAHPSMLRRIGFALTEQLPSAYLEQVGPDAAYGYPAAAPHDEGDIYLGEAMYGNVQWTSPDAAVAWVKDAIRAQGVTVE